MLIYIMGGVMVRDDQDGGVERVNLEDVPRQKGFTFYGSTKIERNSRSVNASATASVTYTPPDDERLEVSIEKWEQVHREVLKRCWDNAQERKIAIEEGRDLDRQFEVDYITGEIR